MNSVKLGTLLIISGLVLSLLFLVINAAFDAHTRMYVLETGTCFLDDGTCLHAENSIYYFVVGWIISTGIIIAGVFMILSFESQKKEDERNKTLLNEIKSVKEIESERQSFEAFLKGFEDGEKKVLRIIREQQGIPQNTLRLKAETSKTALSLMLQAFEKKGIVEKKPDGKTNRVYLKGYFGKE